MMHVCHGGPQFLEALRGGYVTRLLLLILAAHLRQKYVKTCPECVIWYFKIS